MGQTISALLLPVVTFSFDGLSPFYYTYVEPLIDLLPRPRRIMAINWSRLGSNLWGLFTNILQSIPHLVWNTIKLLIRIVQWLFKCSFYPILLATPFVLGYYVLLSMDEPGVISPRRLKETSQEHFLSNQRAYSSHPLRVYADETNSI